MFSGFTKSDFETFSYEGLEERMEAIQERIQPKFKQIGEILCDDLSAVSGNEMYLHIAKHARRTVNPPKDTWLAVCHDKRGYKKHPHFQVGLFDDHVFIWFALIYEVPNKKQIAENFLNHLDEVYETIPKDFVISLDHMKKDAFHVNELDKSQLENMLIRFRDVKKAEFLIGRHIDATNPILTNGNQFMDLAKNTMERLIPLYKKSF
ncbi:YktB family protein [Anaerobacillus isosaccharinicus]|uniref:UPF0637 protein AWH56_016500 n=1 Tax=Anaerobacillus isosaccharinicus TaxID=1532552 RepID=A0A1S2M7J6_9BACI|nr:DUF1054 domain-containing protein [Anaerobacillus isosaccharinicus]MBA5587498.1 DUF1054 domain-containing protein [Anaerobacillus isosaccharinicus]QOY34320.1 DUF1054 domain-containing protein [Anaerobacillus isosaccharinicus]